MGYARFPFREFECYLRFVVGWDDDDIQLSSKQFFSYFITCEKPPGNYLIKVISEIVYILGDCLHQRDSTILL